jgi:glucose-1-phosphate thymidylyltransferase
MPAPAASSRKPRKGIILAGGSGSRLYPSTVALNKHLLPVYDKPMIYYALTTLMLAGLSEITVVSSPSALPQIHHLLGEGTQWGIRLSYVCQPAPNGIADGLLTVADELAGHPIVVILGDNIFYHTGLPMLLRRVAAQDRGATIFAYQVSQPQRYGVVELDRDGRPISLAEKPAEPKSNLAVTGLYFYDERALELARKLRRSARGELEITDLNRMYLELGELTVQQIGRGSAWLDGGTTEDLYEASQFVHVLEERTGLKIACPEEVALRMGFIDRGQFAELVSALKPCRYRSYLETIVVEGPTR